MSGLPIALPSVLTEALAGMLPGVLPGILPGAWRPFLDPLPVDAYWLWALIPLAIAISLVYKAIRLDDLSQLPRQAAVMAFQVVVYMGLCGAAIWLLLTQIG